METPHLVYMSSPIVGPIAPESNPPINPQYFKPRVFEIEDIDLGETTTVTTTEDHDYELGQVVKLFLPPTYCAGQLNNKTGYVISIPADDEVEITIYSKNADAFNASGLGTTKPQIFPIGDINSGSINGNGRVTSTLIEGSFINISPQ